MKEFVPKRTAAYISQYDIHVPLLTVRETLAFSAKCQGVGTGYGLKPLFKISNLKHSLQSLVFVSETDLVNDLDMLTELLRREKQLNIKPDPYIDALMKVKMNECYPNKVEYYLNT